MTSNKNTRINKVVIALMLVAGYAVVATPADAHALLPAVAPEIHCTVDIQPARPGEESVSSEPVCFPTFREAIAFATAGQLILPVGFHGVIPADWFEDRPAEAEDHTVIGVAYMSSNYQGSSLTWIGHGECTWYRWYEKNEMPSGWNDVISSAVEYAGCAENLYWEHANLGGANLDCTCSTMGVMDNVASSAEWST